MLSVAGLQLLWTALDAALLWLSDHASFSAHLKRQSKATSTCNPERLWCGGDPLSAPLLGAYTLDCVLIDHKCMVYFDMFCRKQQQHELFLAQCHTHCLVVP